MGVSFSRCVLVGFLVWCLTVGSNSSDVERNVVEVRVQLNGAVDNHTVTVSANSWDELRKVVKAGFGEQKFHLGADWWFADNNGFQVTTWKDLLKLATAGENLKLSVVPAERFFQWGIEDMQSRIPVKMMDREGVELQPISRHPRIFIIHNLFSETEAAQIISGVSNITDEDSVLRRSSVGLDGNDDDSESQPNRSISRQRTSENAFDDESPLAITLMKRCFDLVRLEYDELKADGLQILRYNESKAYISHTDWFDNDEAPNGENLDPTTSPPGTNRWATIILYLSEPESGGFTVFPLATLENEVDDTPFVSTGRDMNARAEAQRHQERLFKNMSWEAKLARNCYSKLAVKPTALNAVLFYHQDALDGHLLPETKHGGCPSFGGVKWAANMWIWNGDFNFDPPSREATCIFKNTKNVSAMLYWRNNDGDDWELYGKVKPGKREELVTYVGTKWKFTANKVTFGSWEIEQNGSKVVRANTQSNGSSSSVVDADYECEVEDVPETSEEDYDYEDKPVEVDAGEESDEDAEDDTSNDDAPDQENEPDEIEEGARDEEIIEDNAVEGNVGDSEEFEDDSTADAQGMINVDFTNAEKSTASLHWRDSDTDPWDSYGEVDAGATTEVSAPAGSQWQFKIGSWQSERWTLPTHLPEGSVWRLSTSPSKKRPDEL